MYVHACRGHSGLLIHTIITRASANVHRESYPPLYLLQSSVVAIVGPESSEVAHFVSHMAAHTEIPLVSFAASDPALSEYQFPYFTRLVPSDSIQMAAITSLVHYYGWRSVVVIYSDDDYGKDGIEILSDMLHSVSTDIVFKAGLDLAVDNYTIGSILAQLALMESRVFIVHMQAQMARILFATANYLKMMTAGYVWITTDAVLNYLDSSVYDVEFLKATQGVIGTRMYVPTESSQLLAYLKQRNQVTGRTDIQFHPYELLAHDSVYMIAYAIDNFIKQGHSFEFVPPSLPHNMSANSSDLVRLKVLKEGSVLLRLIQKTNFTGITGLVQLSKKGDRKSIPFEILNVVGSDIRVVGYWIDGIGCTITPPSQANGQSTIINTAAGEKLQHVVWPGGSMQVPRGWVVPKSGKPLIIGVPHKTGYKEFITATRDTRNVTTFHGLCINVFESAVSYLPYSVTYTFVSVGNGSASPNYSELISKIESKEFDAVVGDVTITTARSKLVDFTQPYIESGLVVLVPVKGDSKSYAWAFMRPFTPAMWCITCAFFLLTGLVTWILEHKKNKHFRGRPKKQIVTTLWFIFSTLFFSQRENVKSTLGRAVLVIWLFVVLIITSSYTASLTSILTVEQLKPTVQGIAGLVASDLPIGYQGGSFVEDYLLQLNVPKERLIPLNSLESYAKALQKGPSNGGVGAIVDELPYVQLFLSSQCDYTIAGQDFTKGGWGFAFPKGSQLAIDMSTAILELAENGELQQIHDLWLTRQECSSKVQVESNELNIRSFWGLFLITGVTSIFCVTCYLIRMVWRYKKVRASEFPQIQPPQIQPPHQPENRQLVSRFRRGASFLRSLASFIEEAEVNGEGRVSKSSYGTVRSSRERSFADSGLLSMSERSMGSSTRNSTTSTDEKRVGELRELLKELNSPVNVPNSRVTEKGSDSSQVEDQIHCYGSRKGKYPVMAKKLHAFRSFIFKPRRNKNRDRENLAVPSRSYESEGGPIIHGTSVSSDANGSARPANRRSISFKSILSRSGSGKAMEETASRQNASEFIERPPSPGAGMVIEEATSSQNASEYTQRPRLDDGYHEVIVSMEENIGPRVLGVETLTAHLRKESCVDDDDSLQSECIPQAAVGQQMSENIGNKCKSTTTSEKVEDSSIISERNCS
ncbi:hypothetical protein KP509_18G064700 [Ceratopteris richardii]|uniref:Ionotropic glutamate receptor C-terminal domain-containing protein n=1 Tax=Ceratopteris richardii TaxID=49495 RepID=A0A8T2SR20_CERRI|nr:hypothetical protein KP509_18G064700 [Ceratopteris richardii]